MSRVFRILTYALAVLLVNSAYLAARGDASIFYYANVALHAIGGIAVALLGTPGLAGRFPFLKTIERTEDYAVRRTSPASW